MHDWQWHYGFGGGWLMALFWIVLIVAVVVAVYGLVRGGDREGHHPLPSARESLQARYARGEVDRDEYLQKIRDLDEETRQ